MYTPRRSLPSQCTCNLGNHAYQVLLHVQLIPGQREGWRRKGEIEQLTCICSIIPTSLKASAYELMSVKITRTCFSHW